MSYSHELFQAAQTVIPGGVNSPVRAFNGVGGEPIFFKKGQGAYLYDHDDKQYIDYVGSWGPLILGHAHPDVVKAVKETVENGLSFGAPTELEVQLAQKVVQLIPHIDKIRMVNSGTEATLTAIRLARGFTRRNKIVKFVGCYHGHHDSLLVEAGSGMLTLGIPGSPGVPEAVVQDTLTIPYNNEQALAEVFKQYGHEIACVIIEPVAGNMGCILPKPGFLQAIRAHCNDNGSVFIIDEVMTGFRVALKGAQELYDVEADITTYGKVIGGGMPVGAIAGRKAIMDHLAPVGPVYQAGTLSGNPIAMAAGLATLSIIEQPGFFESLATKTQQLVSGLKSIATANDIPLAVTQVGGMFGFCFSEKTSIESFEDVAASDIARFKKFFHGMLNEGVYLAPSAYEAGFVSCMHGEAELSQTLASAEKVMATL